MYNVRQENPEVASLPTTSKLVLKVHKLVVEEFGISVRTGRLVVNLKNAKKTSVFLIVQPTNAKLALGNVQPL